MPASIFGQYLGMAMRVEELLREFGKTLPLKDQAMLLRVKRACLMELRDAGSEGISDSGSNREV